MCDGGKGEDFFLRVIVLPIESKRIDYVLEDMMTANSIS